MIETAEDATVLIGPETYREFIREPQRRLTSHFTRVLLEVHQEGNHQLAEFAEVEGVTALACQNPLFMPPKYQEVALSLRGRKAFYVGASPAESGGYARAAWPPRRSSWERKWTRWKKRRRCCAIWRNGRRSMGVENRE